MWVIAFALLYLGYLYRLGRMEKGYGKMASAAAVFCAIAGGFGFFGKYAAGWLFLTAAACLYSMFYDAEFRMHPVRILLFGIAGFGMALAAGFGFGLPFPLQAQFLLGISFLCGTVWEWEGQRTAFLPLLTAEGILTVLTAFEDRPFYAGLFCFLTLFMQISFEMGLRYFREGYERNTLRFQEDLLGHQYEEIKEIYGNMRGWRHDFHHHLQVIHAYLETEQNENAKHYVMELKEDLLAVDDSVNSGNPLADAVLGSKIAAARGRNIRVVCKAELPEILPVSEVDFCVILGNLLDNAIEACGKIPPEDRFIRIYIAIVKHKFYLSVQNAAKEELDFDERNYITKKRGNHGFGMKRVKVLVDKYGGFLNLKNEAGIFAAEVLL